MKSMSIAAMWAVTVLGTAGCGGSGGMSQPPANTAPALSALGNQSTDQDTPLTVEFGVADLETPVGSLRVSASAADGAVFPADGVVVSGDGATRRLTLTPLEAVGGTATIRLSVADAEGATATRSFQVAVNLRDASVRSMALETFAKGEADTPTTVNGWTIRQDADDPAVFAALIPEGEE